MSKILKQYNVLVLCVIGSLVRFLFGYFFEPWRQAPDQLAWELILEQGKLRYDHLIHYPHEGGTFLISVLAHFIQLFTSFSSLTIAAFLIDFVVRFIQITVVRQMFGIKIATLFGLWTVFATPAIIPWGTVNFGLHAIASLFPFLLLFLLFLKRDSLKFHFGCGIFLGLALWFSYSNLILILVFFLFRILSRQDIKKLVFSILGLTAVLIIHVFVRQFFDAGFHLNELGLGSIRGVDFSFTDINILERLSDVPQVVANSTLALPESSKYMPQLRLVYYSFFVLAVFGFIRLCRNKSFSRGNSVIILIILAFLMVYIVSPFFEVRDKGNFVLFRHLAYIVPLISLFCVLGLSSLKYRIIVILFILLGLVRTGQLFNSAKLPKSDFTNAVGWVLGTKLGHDKNAVVDIVTANPEKCALLSQGIGWGISASLLVDLYIVDKVEAELKITELIELVSEYPESFKNDLFLGIEFAFSPGVTPKLNPELLKSIRQKLSITE